MHRVLSLGILRFNANQDSKSFGHSTHTKRGVPLQSSTESCTSVLQRLIAGAQGLVDFQPLFRFPGSGCSSLEITNLCRCWRFVCCKLKLKLHATLRKCFCKLQVGISSAGTVRFQGDIRIGWSTILSSADQNNERARGFARPQSLNWRHWYWMVSRLSALQTGFMSFLSAIQTGCISCMEATHP